MRKRGFTMLEIMMVLLILSVFSAMAVQSMRQGRNKAGSQGLAMILSEELKRTRQEAIARRRPTALILPTNGGTASNMRSFYIMEGETLPRIVRSRNFISEFAGADLFMGRWNLSSGSWSTTSLKVPGSKWSLFTVDKWLPAGAGALKDYCFVFLPDGTVQTNDLLSCDNRYHVVVAAGASCASISNATLAGAGEAYTVSLSPIGGVTVSSGIYGENGSIVAKGTHSTQVSFTAPGVVSVPKLDPTPVSQYPKIFPTPNTSPFSPGPPAPPDAIISKDQYVSLEILATSGSGEQLFCEWVVDGPGSKVGAFSLQSSQSSGGGAGGRMEWDQNLRAGAGAWKADWQWRPPTDAQPAERYTLTCKVQNLKSGAVDVAIKTFDIEPPGKIFFESDRQGYRSIFTMSPGGQREQVYLNNCRNPTATLDGRRMVYVNNTDGDLYLHVPMDTTPDLRLTNTGDCEFPALSPTGNVVAFYRGDQIYVMKVGFSAVPQQMLPALPPRPTPSETLKLGWTTNGQSLMYPSGTTLMLASLNISPLGVPSLTPGSTPKSTGTGQISSATATFPYGPNPGDTDGILYTDNYSPYDPWIKRDDTNNRQYLSVGFEDGSVERNPVGFFRQFMICHTALAPINRQLHVVTITSQSTANVGLPLTSAGNNTRPVWTL
ncbi:prepilin-type N-terminal cleavage/methylation domain-containing protein [bacterium]|nr:prepilin-type N-terminal cleavage/methylation domain-containing protein [bacterium]